MWIETGVQALEKHKVKYAIVGGYAVILHGVLRATADLDLAISISEKSFVGAEKALMELGLEPRLPVTALEVFKFRKEYIKNRNLHAWSFVDAKNPINVIDIIISQNLDNINTVSRVLGKTKLNVIDIDDLIRMKKHSGRPQDLIDIEALERLK